MVNASLTYEILMYLNSFYFGMFAACEIGMGVLKITSIPYPPDVLPREAGLLIGLCVLETMRIILGRKGSLSDRAWQVFLSVVLLIPCGSAVVYFLYFQRHSLKLEVILCSLQLTLHAVELFFAGWFVCTMCQPLAYY